MRSSLLAVATVVLSTVAFAQQAPEPSGAEVFFHEREARIASHERHVIVSPQHVLSAAERAELAARGLTIDRALSRGRYVGRLAAGTAIGESDPLVRSVEPITADRKLTASAVREAGSPGAFARLDIVFNSEVSFADARAAIEAAGGTIDHPLQTDFSLPRNVRAHVPSLNVMSLAADERVFTMYGPKPRIAVDNQEEAQLSHVDVVQGNPYNLDGSGVVLSIFELSPPDTTHPEFGGRLISHFPADASTADSDHATHTSGTMIAAGNQPSPLSSQAKGMAPAATLHAYSACDDCDWLNDKATKLQPVGAVADNNSWGYVLGWCASRCGSATGWLWTGNDEYIGAYDSTDAAIDQIARTGITLMVHSAGNDAGTTGPGSAPFAHDHTDSKGNTITGETFCYSVDGSGTDCPVPTCSAGPQHCEITRHPTHGTVGSVGLTASAKNIVTVGATDSAKNIAGFSSRGPTRDGRIKPDISAKGTAVLSTVPHNSYTRMSGTSMASPVVTGISALITQQYRKTFNANPLPETIKALLIEGATEVGNPGPDYTFGFGFVDAKNSIDTIVADAGHNTRINVGKIDQGAQLDLPLAVTGTVPNLRVVLVWNDPEVLGLDVPGHSDISDVALVNDLDLVVRDPSGAEVRPYILDPANPGAVATRGVNTRDNVEEVEISGATAGTYHIVVRGTRVIQDGPQQFVVVSNAGALSQPLPPCTDPTEPNDTAAQAFGYIGSGQHVTARFCEASDVDFFKIHVDRPGPLTVTVTATGTPVTVSLSGNGVTGGSADIAANASGTVTANVTSAGDYIVRVAPTGTLADATSYTLTPSFTTSTPARTHAARP